MKAHSLDISRFTDFQQEAVERLKVLLKFKDLKSLAKESRRIRRTEGERDRLAQKIILRYGDRLLADSKRRMLIGKKAGLSKKDIPKRWIYGSEKIKKFVSDVGFPIEFAGQGTSNNISYELLGLIKRKELQEFQMEVVDESLKRLKKKGSRFIISMPTGSGKTLTAIEILNGYLKNLHPEESKNVIWLAHTEELCEQAKSTFKKILSNLKRKTYLFPLWKDHLDNNLKDLLGLGTSKGKPFIMIGTPIKFLNYIEANSGLRDFVSEQTSLVVIDEAHRAGSRTYKRLIKILSNQNKDISFMGLTATPIRGIRDNTDEIEELKDLFQSDLIIPKKTLGNTSEEMTLKLQKLGVLSAVKKISLDMDFKIKIDPKEYIQFLNKDNPILVDRKLRRKSDNDEKRKSILKYLKNITINPDSRFLYFGASKSDANKMDFLLRESFFKSASITSSTKDRDRKQILKDFSKGKIQFLCNCEVLTTGFDEPKIDHIIMARPTISQILYEQMIGRGLRGEKFGGTKICTVLICDGLQFPKDTGYYRFWHSDSQKSYTEFWNYEDFFMRSLLYMISIDSTYYESEIEKLKQCCSDILNRRLTDDEIQEEIGKVPDYMDSYNENLHRMANILTHKQKSTLIENCSSIMICDNDIHEKEIELLKTISSVLNIKT